MLIYPSFNVISYSVFHVGWRIDKTDGFYICLSLLITWRLVITWMVVISWRIDKTNSRYSCLSLVRAWMLVITWMVVVTWRIDKTNSTRYFCLSLVITGQWWVVFQGWKTPWTHCFLTQWTFNTMPASAIVCLSMGTASRFGQQRLRDFCRMHQPIFQS